MLQAPSARAISTTPAGLMQRSGGGLEIVEGGAELAGRPLGRRRRIVEFVRQARRQFAERGHFFRLAQSFLYSTPLGDVDERHHAAREFSVVLDGIRPVLRGERLPVGAEHHLVVAVRALSPTKRLVDAAFLYRIRLAVGAGVVHQLVHLLAHDIVDAVENIVDTYIVLRQPNEPFIEAYQRLGQALFKERLYAPH